MGGEAGRSQLHSQASRFTGMWGEDRTQLSLIQSHATSGGHLEEGGGSGDSFLENVLLVLGLLGWGERVLQRGRRKAQREGKCGGGCAGLLGNVREDPEPGAHPPPERLVWGCVTGAARPYGPSPLLVVSARALSLAAGVLCGRPWG